MDDKEFTRELLFCTLNLDDETVLEFVVDRLMTEYTRECGYNLSTEESKQKILDKVKTLIESEWETTEVFNEYPKGWEYVET